MQVENLEVGVKRALKAYLVARGVSEDQAETKATERLDEACTLVRAALGQVPDVRSKNDMETITNRFVGAFGALKTWSQSI